MNLTRISFQNLKWEGIGEGDKQAWAKAYPACDIEIELAKMAEWLKANPNKKKSNYRRFITNWLSRAQDHGGTWGTAAAGKIKRKRMIKVFHRDGTFHEEEIEE